MATDTLILNAVLKNTGKKKEELFSSLESLTIDDVNNTLKTLKIFEYKARDTFVYRLQTMVERLVYEFEYMNNEDHFPDLIVKEWNNTQSPAISTDVAIAALQSTNLKYPNARKAFVYLSEGQLTDFKIFNDKPKMFIELLIKFLICITPKKKFSEIQKEAEEVTALIFEKIPQWEIKRTVKESGFLFRSRGHYPIMNTYQNEVDIKELVYAKGMQSILESVLDQRENSEVLMQLHNKLEKLRVKEVDSMEKTVDVIVEQVELEESSTSNPIEEEHAVLNTDSTSESKSPSSDMLGSFEESEEGSPVEQDVLQTLEAALQSLQTAIKQVEPLVTNTQSSALQETATKTEQQLAIAEDEIKRLNTMLEAERARSQKIEQEAHKKLLRAIAGEASNYLLSDLFEESQGKTPENSVISAGRLINLFTALGMEIGLEEHTNGREIDEVFVVDKSELITAYHIDASVQSEHEQIKVKLIKYGWTLGGVIVIRPLVTEIKEEN